MNARRSHQMFLKFFIAAIAVSGAVSVSAQTPASQNKTNAVAQKKTAEAAKAAARLDADLGKIKIDAEQGKPSAQVELGNAYLEHFQAAQALTWYQAAATQNSVEGKFHLGKLLLWGATRPEISKPERVPPRPSEGIQWMYAAATNGYKDAWREMARAKQSGIGCQTNLAEAYAWSLLAEGKERASEDATEVLVLKMPAQQIQEGKALAIEMSKRHWPLLQFTKKIEASEKTVTLALNIGGISGSGADRLAIINGKTVAENEAFTLRTE
jgi:hypothetical protein